MPALTANTVTLAEVLEVRGGPLPEEELWPVLCQATQALQDVFLKGKARQRNFGTFAITPETLLLCHTGRIKFSLHPVSPGDRSFVAPETYSRRTTTSDTTLEKICVYSLGMSLFHAAEYEVPVGKSVNLSLALENLLLGMCEESAHARLTLHKVLQECYNHYSMRHYKDVITALVELVLGDEILDEADILTETSDYGTSAEIYPSSTSSMMQSPRHLPSPPPHISSKGHSTSVQLIGANHRPALAPHVSSHQQRSDQDAGSRSPDHSRLGRHGRSRSTDHSRLEQYGRARSPDRTMFDQHGRSRSPGALRHPRSPKGGEEEDFYESASLLDKYKPQLEMSRTRHTSTPNERADLPGRPGKSERGLRPGNAETSHKGSRSQSPQRNGTSSKRMNGFNYHEEDGYYEEPMMHLPPDIEARLRPNTFGRREGPRRLQRYGSENSLATTSSMASGPRSSMFSDGRSSSAISLVQGSYAPESYITDGYESDPYLVSFGSSVSQLGFRRGRDKPSRLDEPQYLSTPNLASGYPGMNGIERPTTDADQYLSLPRLSKPSRGKSNSKNKLKTFFGPEFVMISEDPNKSIVNITPKKAGQLPHGRRMVSVIVLNGQKLQMMIETNTTTQQLYEQVIKYIGIPDKIFFGLAQQKDGELYFLDLDVKLSKYAPPKWKDDPKGTLLEFILYFRVKFYVEKLALIDNHKTKHQFYLQLRKDLLDCRLYCHEEAALTLGGLALQAETGDYTPALGGDYFIVEHYLSRRVLNKVTPEYALQQLPEFHKGFTGLDEHEAEVEFLKEAMRLPEYGLHFYRVQSDKKAQDADLLFLGICVRGVTVYESRGHIKSPIHKHSWQMTKKLSFKKKKFFIEPRESSDSAKLTFYTGHYKKAKYLLSLCTAFHRFQMKMRARLSSLEQEDEVGIALKYHNKSPYLRVPQMQQLQASTDTLRHPVHQNRGPVPALQSQEHTTEHMRSDIASDEGGTSSMSSVDIRERPPLKMPSQDTVDGRTEEPSYASRGRGQELMTSLQEGQLYASNSTEKERERQSDVQENVTNFLEKQRQFQEKSKPRDPFSSNETNLEDGLFQAPRPARFQDRYQDEGLLQEPRIQPKYQQEVKVQPAFRSMLNQSVDEEPQNVISLHGTPKVVDSTLNLPGYRKPVKRVESSEDRPDTPQSTNQRPNDIVASPERDIQVIKLRKEPGKGLGFTILGGENSQRLDLGIFVKSVTEGSVAFKDGRLKAGDRILAVNGTSLEQVSHEYAVMQLKTAPTLVELVVLQSQQNTTAFDISSVPSADSTNEEPDTLEVKSLITPSHQNNLQNAFATTTMSPTSSQSPSAVTSPTSPRSPSNPSPASFGFHSEDEPVTMISKSISSLATGTSKPKTQNPAFYGNTTSGLSYGTSGLSNTASGLGFSMAQQSEMAVGEKIVAPVAMEKSESAGMSLDVTEQSSQRESLRDTMTSHSSVTSEDEMYQGDSEMRFVVELEKIGSSLGLSVSGGVNTTVKLGGIYVKSLMLNGPADRNGKIRIGDRILEVNGVSLVGVTHKQAVEIIKRAPQRCRLVIDRSIQVNVPVPMKRISNKDDPEGQTFTVDLVKGIGGLGLSLVGGRDSDPEHGGLLRIKKMFPGQPATLSGKLQVGDIIQEVNGKSLANASHQDAINIIRQESPAVQLLIKRDPNTVPPSLLSRANSTSSEVDPAQLLTDIQRKLRNDSPMSAGTPEIERAGVPVDFHVITSAQINTQYGRPKFLSSQPPIDENSEERPDSGVVTEKSLSHQASDPVIQTTKKHDRVTTSYSLPSSVQMLQNTQDGQKSAGVVHRDSTSSTGSREPMQKKPVPSSISSDDGLPLRQPTAPSPPQYGDGNISSDDEGQGSMDSVPEWNKSDIHSSQEDISVDFGNEEEVSVDAVLPMDLPGLESRRGHGPDQTKERTLEDENPPWSSSDESDQDEKTPTNVNSLQRRYDSLSDDSDIDLPGTEDPGDINEMEIPRNEIPRTQSTSEVAVPSSHSPLEDILEIKSSFEHSEPLSTSDKKLCNTLSDREGSTSPVSESTERDLGEELRDNAPQNAETSSSSDGSENDEPVTQQINPVEPNLEASLTPKEVRFVVELTKGTGGLGFTLAGGADTMGGCFVRDVIGDPAKSDGRLQKGDQILQVDDVDISEMKHMAAVNVLRATKKHVRLEVLRRPTVVVSDSKSGETYETVNLTRTVRGRIGLILREGEGGKILVDDVVPGEPAAQQGNLKHGDRIIEIGGKKVDGVGFLVARQYLDAARPVVQLVVERCSRVSESKYSMGASLEQSFSLPSEDIPHGSDVSSHASDDEEEKEEQVPRVGETKDELYTMQLRKGPRGFGFSLVAAPSSVPNLQGIFIKTISPGSVAEEDGRLRVGDQILKVNGEDVQGMSHARVIGMLRKISTTVDLEIKRPAEVQAVHNAAIATKRPAPTPPSNIDTSPRPPLQKRDSGLDLEITLEDNGNKEAKVDSNTKEDDEITGLINAISSGDKTSPSTTRPQLNKRDTDAVLSSLLGSINSNSSKPTLDSSWASSAGSDQEGARKSGFGLDEDRPGYSTADSIPHFSSGSSEDKRMSDSSFNRGASDSMDSDYDDADVFDMLRDNSQMVIDMLKDADDLDSGYVPSTVQSPPLSSLRGDVPPPIPTTPIPSDSDDEPPPTLPAKSSRLKSGDSKTISNGFVNHDSSGSDIETSGPLINVRPGGRYAGHRLKMLTGALQTKLDSGMPEEEFKDLREIKPTDGCDSGKNQANTDKNRYRNVLPYEATRVRLSGSSGEDYINANHIRVLVDDETYHYIATQGPLPNTTKDFWQMIWEQGVEVVAMVTLDKEGGKVKCHRYWPDNTNQPLKLGGRFEVSLLKQTNYDSFVHRDIAVKHLQSGKSIEIAHLNFVKWPDHGVPRSPVEMVQFVAYMRSLATSQAPVVVHCSAGIGRTGALIAVDVALGLMERDKPFDINQTIRDLREQRQGMIQTKDQYIFCYKACLEVLKSLAQR